MKLPSASVGFRVVDQSAITLLSSSLLARHATPLADDSMTTEFVATANVSASLNSKGGRSNPVEFYVYVCFRSIAFATVIVTFAVVVVCRKMNSHNFSLCPYYMTSSSRRSSGRPSDSIAQKCCVGTGEPVDDVRNFNCSNLATMGIN